MKDLADELARRRAAAQAMGGEDAVARQHGAGKLTVRERIDLLFDGGTFTEIGVHATHAGISPDMIGKSTAVGRIGEVADMVGWVLFLAAPEAGYLTGQTLSVNGGRLMV